jgi:hypothetical protein
VHHLDPCSWALRGPKRLESLHRADAMFHRAMVLFQYIVETPYLPDFNRSSVLGVIAGNGRG